MGIKKDILARINIIFVILCAVGALIIAQAFRIQTFDGQKWIDAGKRNIRIDTTSGERGNIYSADGQLLATSLPFFDISIDPTVAPDSLFNTRIDSLCIALSNLFDDTPAEEFRAQIVSARKEKVAFLRLRKSINFDQLSAVKAMPILNLGRYKGGLIVENDTKRVRPFDPLAQRTIGYLRDDLQTVGLEGAFDNYLAGLPIARRMQRVRGGFINMSPDQQTDDRNGKDIITNLDINLQDVANNALARALQQHHAAYGCAIVMEVKTGAIKAIANLGRSSDSTEYSERYNYAIGEQSEPGSTFKVASLAALLEDGFVTDSTVVDVEWGKKKFYDKVMTDSHPPSQRKLTVRSIIETSSNVGIAKLVEQYYGKQPERFVQRLEQMQLHLPTGIEVTGEPKPRIKKPNTASWSGVTLPWSSIGYEIKITPLQLLTFYNAIANGGKMMKPYLVSAVTEQGEVVRTFSPTVVADHICTPQTAATITDILKGVLEEGTAKALYTGSFAIAGKTGTAKIAKDNQGYRDLYQASIAGYFPADAPLYSCIVVINSPTGGDYYGASVAGPVFKEIVEKCYALSTRHHQPINMVPHQALSHTAPATANGYGADLQSIYQDLQLPITRTAAEWLTVQPTNDTLNCKPLRTIDNLLPDVRGMGLRDAVFMLESKGLKVHFVGKGRVYKQNPPYASRYKKGDVVYIQLK